MVLVCQWAWAVQQDNCPICRNYLSSPSVQYSLNPCSSNENGLSVTFGVCHHAFHLDCIQDWLTRSNVCALCSKDWDYGSIRRISGNDN